MSLSVASRDVLVGLGLLLAMAQVEGSAFSADWEAEFGQYVVAVRGVSGDSVSVACASASIVEGRASRFVVFSPDGGRVLVRGSEIYPEDPGDLVGLASWSGIAAERGRLVAGWASDEGLWSTDVLCLKGRKRLFRLPGRWPVPLQDLDMDSVGDLLVVTTRMHEGSSVSALQFVSGESGEVFEEWALPGEVTGQPAVLDLSGLASVQCLVPVRVGDTLRLIRKSRDAETIILEVPDASFPAWKKLLPFSSVAGLGCDVSAFFTSVVHSGAEPNELSMHFLDSKGSSMRLTADTALADPWGWGANYFGSSVESYRLGHGDSSGQVLVGAHGAELGMGVVIVFDAADGRVLQILENPTKKSPQGDQPLASTHFGNYLCLTSGLQDGRGDWLLVGAAFLFDAQPGAIHAYENSKGLWKQRMTFEEKLLK